MNYIVFMEGVAMVVSKQEWKWWPKMKTVFPDEKVANHDVFMKSVAQFLKQFE